MVKSKQSNQNSICLFIFYNVTIQQSLKLSHLITTLSFFFSYIKHNDVGKYLSLYFFLSKIETSVLLKNIFSLYKS